MNRRAVTVILFIICVLGGAGSIAAYLTADKQGPRIGVPAERPRYREGEELSVLLEGVTAQDDRDGDVTAQVVVEAIYPAKENGTAKVVYAAVDSSNNVTKVQRIVDYVVEEETEPETELTEETESEEPAEETETDSSAATRMTAEEAKAAGIAVVNGTEVGGLAGSWGNVLAADGYTQVRTGNYEGTVQRTVIYAEDEGLVRGLQVYFPEAEVSGEMPKTGIDIELNGLDACVIVGNDYTEIR